MISIENELRVALHPVHSGHRAAMMEWRNHPDIRRWCRQEGLISDRDQARWFEKQNDDPTIRMFAVAAGDEHVGTAGLTSIDFIHRRAEFSLYIAPDHQRKGYARWALKTLLWHGFVDLNLNVIWGETFDKNPAVKLFEQLGMEREGTRKEFYYVGGEYVDAHLYSISRHRFSL